ncbi:hypothetical protein [Glutamicibacter sp. X7]
MGKRQPQMPVPMVLDTKAEWLEAAATAIADLASEGHTFTADAVRERIPAPAEPNWFGAAFSAARESGVIEAVGFELSRTRSRRGGVLRRWQAKQVRRG